jgi:hypothetical protein
MPRSQSIYFRLEENGGQALGRKKWLLPPRFQPFGL